MVLAGARLGAMAVFVALALVGVSGRLAPDAVPLALAGTAAAVVAVAALWAPVARPRPATDDPLVIIGTLALAGALTAAGLLWWLA